MRRVCKKVEAEQIRETVNAEAEEVKIAINRANFLLTTPTLKWWKRSPRIVKFQK